MKINICRHVDTSLALQNRKGIKNEVMKYGEGRGGGKKENLV